MAHPLDPLSPEELTAAISILRREQSLTRDHLLVFTLLDEPSKESLAAWSPGGAMDRAARITVWGRAEGMLIESVVGLDGTVRRWEPQPGQKAALLGPEATACLAAAKSDPLVLAGLKKRGITDISRVHMETWPFGIDVPAHLNDGRRLFWTPMWHRPTPGARYIMSCAKMMGFAINQMDPNVRRCQSVRPPNRWSPCNRCHRNYTRMQTIPTTT